MSILNRCTSSTISASYVALAYSRLRASLATQVAELEELLRLHGDNWQQFYNVCNR